jgi:hypothetical protein
MTVDLEGISRSGARSTYRYNYAMYSTVQITGGGFAAALLARIGLQGT